MMSRLTRFSKWNNVIPVGQGAVLSHRDFEWKAVQKRKRLPASLFPCCTALPLLYSVCERHRLLTGWAPWQQVTSSNVDEDRQQCWVCCADEINWRGGRAEQGSCLPMQELPVQELMAALKGTRYTGRYPSHISTMYSHRVRPTSSLCCAGHSTKKALFDSLMD